MADQMFTIRAFASGVIPAGSPGVLMTGVQRTQQIGTMESLFVKASSAGTGTITGILNLSPDDDNYEYVLPLFDYADAPFLGNESDMHRVLFPVVGAPFFKVGLTNPDAVNAVTVDMWLCVRDINL